MAKSENINGVQKAAILLIALGPDKSANVFKHLKEDEIEQLTLEIANTRSVSPAIKDSILDEFYEVCLAQQYIAEGGITYAKDLLEKALGAERAKDVIGKLTASLQVRPFEFVRKTDASQLLNFIQDEHPQTIALILSYLSPGQASAIISALAPEKQTDVAKRIAQMDRTSPDVIKEVEKVLEQKLSSLVNQDYTIVGGVDSIVDILNTVDRGTEKHIMESLEIEDPELADEIRKKMFVFEDILLLDEPTNHLDTKGRSLLYEYIAHTKCTSIIVSHDRALLNLLHEVYEISQSGMQFYPMNYDNYREMVDMENASRMMQFENRQKELAKAEKLARKTMDRQQKHASRGEKQSANKCLARISMGNLQNKSEATTSRLNKVQQEKWMR